MQILKIHCVVLALPQGTKSLETIFKFIYLFSMYVCMYVFIFLSFSIQNRYKIGKITDDVYLLSSSLSDATSSDNDLEYEDYK